MKNTNNVLILGSRGYIGSVLSKHLWIEGYDIDSVDLEWYGENKDELQELNKNLKLDYKDLTKEFLSDYNVIILLAGHSSVKMCQTDQKSSLANNVVNFVNLLDKIEDQKLIFSSSASVYGNISAENVTEDCVYYNPYSYYDLTKNIIDSYAKLSGKNYYGLRFGTVCGASPNLRTDIMINAMYCTGKKTGNILLFNNNVWRPILGLKDLCNAIQTIIASESRPGIYNLASFNDTAEGIAQKVSQASGFPVKKVESDSKLVINEKLQNSTYNFSISSEKFCQTYNFKFTETAESITRDLMELHKNGNFIQSDRSQSKQYQ